MRSYFVFLLSCLVMAQLGVTQTVTEQGSPFIKNYTSAEMNGGPQIWCWVQDNRGMVYVGDMGGIIEFNGKDWRRISNNNNSIVRSMAVDSLGLIYVGASNDFGYLQPNSQGEMKYVSLSKPITDQGIKFHDIWNVFVTHNGVHFCSNKYVFRYFNKHISVIPVNFNVQDAYLLNNQLYLPTKTGLCLLRDTTLAPISAKVSFDLTPWHGEELLSIYGHGNLYTFNLRTSEIKEFKTQAQRFFNDNPVAEIIEIDENKFAVATETNKILILSNSGEVLRYIDKESGLMNGRIYNLFVDKDKNLWACTSKGISKIDINFPVVKFGEKHNINNNVTKSILFNGKRYIGAIDGIYFLPPFDINKPDESQKFVKIKAYVNECWDFMVAGNQLYAISSNGLWVIDDTIAKLIYSIEPPQKAHCFNTSHLFPNVIFVGMRGKLLALKLNSSKNVNTIKVVDQIDFPEITEKIRRITPDKDGNLWLNTQFDGVYFIRFTDGNIHNYRVTLLGKKNGLTNLDDTRTYEVASELVTTTESGIFQPIFPTDKNAPDSLIRFGRTMLFGDTIKDPYAIVAQVSKNKYLIAGYGMHYATIDGAKQTYDTCGFYRLSCSVENVSIGADSIISLSSPDGLFNYDIKNHRNFEKPFNVIVSKVETNNDSTLFGGCFYTWRDSAKIASLAQNAELVPTLAYRHNSVTIHFAGLFYEEPESTQFIYQLEGFDKKWSNPSSENKAVYTNLREGKYTFKVRATNAYGIKSNEASYSFTISPPFYRTWGAYLLYFSLFVFIVYLVTIVYTRRLLKQKYNLELTVEKRTDEIIEQARELKRVNEKLIEMDQFKQGITSMIVHDLKNPINSIINIRESNPELQLNRIRQTGRQMLNLVLNILDVSKYEETQIVLNTENHNLFDIAQNAIEKILFLSMEKNIEVSNRIDREFCVRADIEMTERVFINILTNAIKYTPNNGLVLLNSEPFSMSEKSDQQGGIDQFVKISITDNGMGISADKIHLVFQKFGQVIAKNSGSVRSTGLGLTYCKMVVEAHGGDINVESELEKGSQFWFTMPRVEGLNTIGNTTVLTEIQEYKSINLSLAGKQLIKKHLIELQQTEFYKITELSVILEKIDDSTNNEIRIWKQALIRAIDSGNELLYKKLSNL